MQLGTRITPAPPTLPRRRVYSPDRRDRKVLTAAGQRIDLAASLRKGGQVRVKEWQTRNWTFYDQIGAVHYGLNYKHNAITKMQFYPARQETPGQEPAPINVDDEDNPPTSDDLAAWDEFDRLNDAIAGGFAALAADASVNLEVVGECYLWGWEDDDGEDHFEILSTEELREKQSLTSNDEDDRRLREDDVLVRIYIPHPRNSKRADAPLSSVAFECEELILLARAMRSSATARLSNGVLLVPTEMSFAEDEVVDQTPVEGIDDVTEDDYYRQVPLDDADQTEDDPFQAELIEAMLTPKNRDGTPADVVPLVWRGPSEHLKEVRHITFTRDEAADRDRRNELLTRIAHGIDMPPEVILGVADMNHWSAWMVDESTYKQHIDPVVLVILEAVTRAYYWPALQLRGVQDFRQYRIWRNITALVAHPNRFSDAVRAFDRGGISWAALRREGNFGDEDAPDEDELLTRNELGFGGRGTSSSGSDPAGPENVTEGPPGEDDDTEDEAAARQRIDPTVADRVRQAMTRMRLQSTASTRPDLTVHAAAAGTLRRFAVEGGIRATGLGDIDVGVMERIQAATEIAVDRALEKAGARLVTKVRNDETLRALIRDVPKSHVPATLGPERVKQLQIRAEDLVPPDTFEDLGEDTDDWLLNAQDSAAEEVARMSGVEFERDTTGEDEDRGAAVGWFVGSLTAAVIALLFNPDRDVLGSEGEGITYRIDPGMIATTVSIAGGSGQFMSPKAAAGTWSAGIGNGQRTLDYLITVGLQPSGYVWRYGDPSARKVNFEPHRRLNGLEFSSWTDEALSTSGTGASWVGSYFEPRDHRGCLCWVDRVVRNQPRFT